MATIKYAAPASPETVMTTELNSIASSAGAITASAISNDASGELYLYASIELYLAAQGANRSSTPTVTIFIIPEISGSYSWGDGSTLPPGQSVAITLALTASTLAACRAIAFNIPLPPTDFHMVVWNNTGQSFASSGNTLKIERYNMQSA